MKKCSARFLERSISAYCLSERCAPDAMVDFLEPADTRNATALHALRRKPRDPSSSSTLSLVTLRDPSPTPRNTSLYSAGTS